MRCTTAAVSGVLLVLALFAGPSAQAASYTVWSCRGPDGTPLSTAAWQAIGDGAGTDDSCASGGSLSARLRESDGPSLVHGYRFALPPGTGLSGYRVHLYAHTAPDLEPPAFQAGLDYTAAPASSIDAGCPAADCTFGVTDPPLAGGNLVASADIDRDRLSIATICDKPFGCAVPAGSATLAEVRLYRAEVDVRDDDLPVLFDPSGLPAEGQIVNANSLVTFDASDGGGGVQTLALVVDGNEVAHQDAGGACRQPFVQVAPCPAQVTAALPLPVTALSPGPHSASVRAVDAAGNVATSAPVKFTVTSPPVTIVERIVQVPQAAAQIPVTIAVARDRIALPSKGRTISGVVLDAAGDPVAGLAVLVRSRPFGVRRGRTRLERTVRTDVAGRFEAPPGTASRLIVLDVNDAAYRAVEPVEVGVMQRLTVGILTRDATLRNGSTLLVRASVSGVGSGAGGKVVLVQAFVEGRWTTVDSLSAGSDGRALWRYRFRATTRRIAYRFRVKVERLGDVWPWPTTTSRVLRVEVRP